MTTIDQFESVFKAAAKEPFQYEPPVFKKIMCVHDDAGGEAFVNQVRGYLGAHGQRAAWRTVDGDVFANVGGLLELVAEVRPHLICTYRHLKSDAWQWSHSLGEYLDVLTQATKPPVLVLPHPKRGVTVPIRPQGLNSVMAITNHLTGDNRLVNYGAALVSETGRLYLTHVEELHLFERYMEVISKVPAIDTETAREHIRQQLLKEPADFAARIEASLERHRPGIQVEALVTMGHRLAEYKDLIGRHEIECLVFNTKDDDQMAMDGMAYPLAVELRQLPLLML